MMGENLRRFPDRPGSTSAPRPAHVNKYELGLARVIVTKCPEPFLHRPQISVPYGLII